MLGCESDVLMAASITAIFSRLACPDMLAGRMMDLTATWVSRHRPARKACRSSSGEVSHNKVYKCPCNFQHGYLQHVHQNTERDW